MRPEFQFTDSLLMVRPAAFRANPATMDSNPFQDRTEVDLGALQDSACAEFDAMLQGLRAAGLRVLVLQDEAEPATPDSIFPNNWFSTHADGRVILYPMRSPSRRAERRPEALLQVLRAAGYRINSVNDDLVRRFEPANLFLEGTGSMLLDRVHGVAYANRSTRTSEEALAAFCEAHGFQAMLFDAVDAEGLAYYHTNVIMALGLDFALLCLESIPRTQQAALCAALDAGGRRLLPITRAQVLAFAGNMLEVHSTSGERLLLLSEGAHAALDAGQRSALQAGGCRLLPLSIPNIERFGGGSVRCMLAEIFLPRD